jgi:hypothetical protein
MSSYQKSAPSSLHLLLAAVRPPHIPSSPTAAQSVAYYEAYGAYLSFLRDLTGLSNRVVEEVAGSVISSAAVKRPTVAKSQPSVSTMTSVRPPQPAVPKQRGKDKKPVQSTRQGSASNGSEIRPSGFQFPDDVIPEDLNPEKIRRWARNVSRRKSKQEKARQAKTTVTTPTPAPTFPVPSSEPAWPTAFRTSPTPSVSNTPRPNMVPLKSAAPPLVVPAFTSKQKYVPPASPPRSESPPLHPTCAKLGKLGNDLGCRRCLKIHS